MSSLCVRGDLSEHHTRTSVALTEEVSDLYISSVTLKKELRDHHGELNDPYSVELSDHHTESSMTLTV